MAKKKLPRKRLSKKGFLGGLAKDLRTIAKAFDKSMERMVNRPDKVIRRASQEWSDKAHSGRGERLPTKPITGKWTHQTEGDKQRWYANFEGVNFTFVIWPEDDLDKVEKAARAEAERMYGSYAQGWALHELRLIGTLAEEENQDTNA